MQQAGATLRRVIVCDQPQSADEGEQEEALVIYPRGRGGLTIYRRDLECLKPNRYIDDQVINVALKRLFLDGSGRYRHPDTFLCDSHLYAELTRQLSTPVTPNDGATLIRNFGRVHRWFPEGGPFDKGLVCVPVCERSHWYLIMVLRTGATSAVLYQADSLGVGTRAYAAELMARFVGHRTGEAVTVEIRHVPVLRQTNGTDCVLHVLHNAERWLTLFKSRPNATMEQLLESLNAPPCPVTRQEVHEAIVNLGKGAHEEVAAVPDNPTPAEQNEAILPVEWRVVPQVDMDLVDPYPPPLVMLLEPDQILTYQDDIHMSNGTNVSWGLNADEIQECVRFAVGALVDSFVKRRRRLRFTRRIGLAYVRFTVNRSGRCNIHCKEHVH